MSLSVHDPRSRGRSKSNGRERSRSRDIRAPSPPEIRPKKSSKDSSRKTSKKYYDDDSSDSDKKSRRPSKKYYDNDDSDSFEKTVRSSKKYYEDDSDSQGETKRSSKKYYDDDSDSGGKSKRVSRKSHADNSSDSDPRRNSKKSSKKYYDEESESSSDNSGDRDRYSDRRKSKHESSRSNYKATESKHQRDTSPDLHAAALTRKLDYVQTSKPQYERKEAGQHASYASPDRYEHGRPSDYTRHMSYSSEKSDHRSPGTELPGQYKWEYDHPSESHDRNHHPPAASAPEQTRHLSLSSSGNFNVNIGGHSQQPQYGHPNSQPLSPQFTQSQYRPDNQRSHAGSITSTDHYQYADPSHQIAYGSKTENRKPAYTQSAHPQFTEIKPKTSVLHTKPTEGLGSQLHRLSVSGGTAGGLTLIAPGQTHGHSQGGLPPGSPLLEPYHGTYQSISPMPSPMMIPSKADEDLSDLEPLSAQYSSDDYHRGHAEKPGSKKRVSFYDPEDDARALAVVLVQSKPNGGPLIKILPRLSDDNILELRTEYKKHAKMAGKGINIAKHIKSKVFGNLGKIAYAVALGRWESEAHWANFWYQTNSSRRELLIESLMGRTNSEIVKIKDAFTDKRYNSSLEKCMQMELRKDKFRNAILLALEEKRMPENEKLSIELVRRDVQDLYRALTSKDAGETAMINIIVVRSDFHLREVLRMFEGTYHKNFAREMIQKSRNLVGETLAHILNGVLNRPVRDALLLHQALAETSKDRTELLVSRLVRFHWEPRHFEKIKVEYRNKYGEKLEHAIAEGTKGEFGEFCKEICKGQK